MILLRSLAFQLAFAGWTLVLGMASIAMLPSRLAVLALSHLWTRGALAMLRAICGLTYEIAGRENLPTGPAIVAAKHQSAWETLALAALLDDPAFVLKRSLLLLPFVGWCLARLGMIAIDRTGGAGALRRMIAAARRVADRGRPIVVFPEGTRTAPGERRPYHPGVYALYHELALPVVPVAHNAGLYWPRRSVLRRPGRIVISFEPAIAPGLSRHDFLAKLERRIETASARLAEEGPAPT
jgi:1-acyl-sn-glycerol-3-phosphate acyltransferase